MKTISILSALSAILFFFSCQKEISFDTGTGITDSSSFLVKTYTEDFASSAGNSVITYNLSYDAAGRLTSRVSASSPGDKFIYQYNADNSFTMDLYNANALSIHEFFLINSLSLVDSTLQYNDSKDSSTEKYLYNSAGQLVQMKEYDYSAATGAALTNQHHYTYDDKGNQLSDTDNSTVITYDYDLTLLNSLSVGNLYYYKNKNLPKTTTVKSGSDTETWHHSYVFDDKNRLSVETITTSNGVTLKTTYTY